jgi:hypothetical protein
MRSLRPFAMPPMHILSATETYDYVLENAGANYPKRDIVDERIIEEVRTKQPYYVADAIKYQGDVSGLSPKSQAADGSFKYRRMSADSYKLGIITDPRQMGGYPEYKGTPRKDSDGDGMPDSWEIANGLNPNDPSDATGDLNGDGYTNIEKWINGIPTQSTIDWRNLNNNFDTLKAYGISE